MVKHLKHLYEFGSFVLDPDERLLQHDGKPVSLTPKVFDLLLVLIENKGHLLEKEDLMRALWQDSFVEEGNLSFNISTLRKALGENPKERQYIETVPKRGYRFVANVRIVEQEVDEQQIISREAAAQTVASRKEAEESFNETEKDRIEKSDFTNLPLDVKNNGQLVNETVEAVETRFSSKSKDQSDQIYRGPKVLALAAIFIAIAGIAIFALYKLSQRPLSETPKIISSQPMKITRVTTARNAIDAAISPDGKYVAYVIDEARRRSLWLRQINTNSETQIIPPADVAYFNITFSLDGNYINYFKADLNSPPALYQIPTVGGTPRKLIDDVPSFRLSPDGRQIAFTRQLANGESMLAVANASDSSNEQKLISRNQPTLLQNPVWSPDGKIIICLAINFTDTGRQINLIEVSLTDKSERTIASTQWKFVGPVAWLPDGSGLITTVSDYSFGPYQIWHVSYPDGNIRQVTNDLSNYGSVSLSSDSKTLVTVQSDIRPFVWVLPIANTAEAKQITSSPGTRNDYWGFSWTPDERILYVSTVAGNQDIWVMNSDGSNQKQLTFDINSDFDPSVSPDGRYIIFASERSGKTKIWQMDVDGENLRQITHGSTSDYLPYYTPDGRSVVYTSSDTRDQTLWKIALEKNSLPTQLLRYSSTWGAVSRDNSQIAFWYENEKNRLLELAVASIEGGEPIKTFSISPTAKTWGDIHWTSDGQAIAYIDTISGVGNIWLQPLQGGSPKQLTDFKTDRIFRFAISPDGKQIVLSRGIEINDVVLISNFR